MFLWYVGLSVLLVANVFKSVGLDYRLIAVGAMLPLLVDLPVGYRAFGHSLCFAALALVIVMIWPFRGSRLRRRRWLCVPIGIFAGLVLSGAWMDTEVFWWPLAGTSFGVVPLRKSPTGRPSPNRTVHSRSSSRPRPTRPSPRRTNRRSTSR